MRNDFTRCREAGICLCLLGLLLVLGGTAFAQQETATLTGVVQDPSGAVIPGANVRLTNLGTNIASNTLTGENGFYTLTNLKPGAYSVTVEKAGFKKFIQSGVTLQVNQAARLDISLQLGTATELVEVTAEAPLVETESANRGAVIDPQKIADLPLNGRDYNQLALLGTGVLPATPRFNFPALQFKGAFNVNGNRVFMNVFLLDGLDNVSYSNSYRGENVQVVQPSIDALQEFKIQTSNYSAEFGRSAGAVINATIKSGANNLHGTVYEFLRNDKLDASNFFSNFNALSKPERRLNQFGGSLGGPIVRNKTFFFGDYEGLRDRTGQVYTRSIPTAAMKAGNFAGLAALRDPTVSGCLAAGNCPPFSGNVIPPGKFDPIGVKLLSSLPDPTGAGLANNYARTVVNANRTDQFDARVDHMLSERLNYFARYSFVDSTIIRPSPFPGLAEGSFIDTFGTTENRSQAVASGVTWSLNPRAIVDLRGSFVRGSFHVRPPNFGTGCPSDLLGISTPAIDKQFCGGYPKINVSGFDPFGRHTSTPQVQEPESYNLRGSLSLVRGNHLLKFGTEYLYVTVNILDIGQLIGNFSFDGTYTGNAVADILLGMPRQFSSDNGIIFDQSQRMHFAYFQDDWKVTPKLTLNLGLRYEYATPVREAQDRFSNFDPKTNTYIFAQGGNGRSLVNDDKNDFGPRFGFSWQPAPRTVIRGGYGVFYNHTNRQGREGLLGFNPPFLVEPVLRGTTTAPPFFLRQGYPSNIFDPAAVGGTVFRRAQQIDQRTPYVQQWSFGIQRELIKDLVLDVAYVGNKGTKLPAFRNLNPALPGLLPDTAANEVSRQNRRLYPTLLDSDVEYLEYRGNTNYHSLQVRLEKRFSAGFSTLASYTYGKALGNSVDHLSTSGAGAGYDIGVNRDPQEPRNARPEYGPLEFDVTHRFVWTYIWGLPVGKGQRFLSDLAGWKQAVFGAWQVNGINTFQTGLALTPSISSSLPNNSDLGGERARRPDLIGPLVPSGFHQTINGWFDTTQVAIPCVNRPFTSATDCPSANRAPSGSAGVGIVRGPGLATVDFSVFKNFQFGEQRRLQFRTEMFNLFNRANFGLPTLTYAGTPTGGGFGTIRVATPARIIQFGLKFYF